MNQKVISITQAMKLFPDFHPQWQAHHPACNEPESVALGNPKFGTVRHVVVVETDPNGIPVKALYDKMQIEEGAVGQDFPGTIIVPWYKKEKDIFIVLRPKQRSVRGTELLELPQGYAESGEDRAETAVRELAEELLGLAPLNVAVLPDVCPEPDWFPRGTAVAAIEVDPADLPASFAYVNLSYLAATQLIDSATSLAALVRFMAWLSLK